VRPLQNAPFCSISAPALPARSYPRPPRLAQLAGELAMAGGAKPLSSIGDGVVIIDKDIV